MFGANAFGWTYPAQAYAGNAPISGLGGSAALADEPQDSSAAEDA